MKINISEWMDNYDAAAYPMRERRAVNTDRVAALTMQKLGLEPSEAAPRRSGRRLGRSLLIAAAVAALLIGTALAVYRYTLRDAAIEDVPTMDSELYSWKAGETETRLSLSGFSDSPEYQAQVEWTEWNRAWREAHPEPWKALGVDDSYYETPVNYLQYDAYFTEQGEKLDEIVAKYGLTLLDISQEVRSESELCRALGAENILADGFDMYGDYFYGNGTFKIWGDAVLNGKLVDFTVVNAVKGSFLMLTGLIPDDYTEWSYTTEAGYALILMTDTLRERTTLIAPLDGCTVTAILSTDDAQAAEDFAEAIDLAALDALFATDSARAAVVQSIAAYEPPDETESDTTASLGDTPEERFQNSIMPLRRVFEYYDAMGITTKQVLSELGNYDVTAVSAERKCSWIQGERETMYEYYWDGPATWSLFYKSYRGNSESERVSLSYRRFDDGRTAEGFAVDKRYDSEYGEVIDCKVGDCDAYLANPFGKRKVTWYDAKHDLIFQLGDESLTDDELIAMAESVAETAWDSHTCEPSDAAEVLDDLGSYELPGMKYGSIVKVYNETSSIGPDWFMEDTPHATESAEVTYAGGLSLIWGRTWADTERTTENGADYFAAMEKYYLACDDSGAVQTGLSVNGWDAIYLNVTGIRQEFLERIERLIWYDADAELLFTITSTEQRTAAQLITLAESVAK